MKTRPKDAAGKLTRAITRLVTYHPFYGNLAFGLRRVEASWLPTCATDGVHMFYNAAFIESLDDEGVMACMAHEVMHCAMQHFTRRGARDMKRMNLGGDMAINTILRDSGMKLPEGVVYPATYKLEEGQTMEWYADHLPSDVGHGDGKCDHGQGGDGQPGDGAPQSGNGCTEDHGGCSGVLPLPGTGADGKPQPGKAASEADEMRAASDWRTATIQAAAAARAAGHLPGALDRFVGELTTPSVDWKAVLRRFVSAISHDDYRMFPSNRRYISSGLYLPSMRSDSIGEIVVVVDASGSIGEAEFKAFCSETNAILDEVRPSTTHVMYHATTMFKHETFTPDEYPIEFNVNESGGTNFQCVVDAIADAGIDPVAVVWFTDMYPDNWPTEPAYPILWAATTNVDGPYGETVKVTVS